jgi:ribosomal protein S18 acetylase RimI-like enzyme
MTIISPSDMVSIRPFDETNNDDVVRIHQEVLGYTFNSMIGKGHLSYIYSLMARSDGCFVGVAYVGDRTVGVISGTIHLEQTKKILMQSLNLKAVSRIIIGILRMPSLIGEVKKGDVIGQPIYLDGKPVNAILTTIAISKTCQGNGIGRQLVGALEKYFLQNRIDTYRLDTLIRNNQARRFYKALGFSEMTSRADSIILVKRIIP